MAAIVSVPAPPPMLMGVTFDFASEAAWLMVSVAAENPQRDDHDEAADNPREDLPGLLCRGAAAEDCLRRVHRGDFTDSAGLPRNQDSDTSRVQFPLLGTWHLSAPAELEA